MKALILALILISITAPMTVADTPSTMTSVGVVRAYIAARDRHDAKEAYALISSIDRESITLDDLHQSAKRLAWAAAPENRIAAAYSLVYDIHGTTGLRFKILGLMPNVSDDVVVVVDRPRHPEYGLNEIVVATVIDPIDGRRRIDAHVTLSGAAPNVLRDARDEARSISCVSNMKIMGLAILEYEQDHDEYMPDADRWMDEIKPYVESPGARWSWADTMHCPADSDDHAFSYSYNRRLDHVNLAQLADPANTVMVFESSKQRRNQSDYGSTLQIPSRHPGGNCYLFADGHAREYSDLDHPSIKLDKNFMPLKNRAL